jgi:hypothetical protein
MPLALSLLQRTETVSITGTKLSGFMGWYFFQFCFLRERKLIFQIKGSVQTDLEDV